jgi:uncharacterized membrane protein YfcA
MILVLLVAIGVLAGAVAAVAGFGIGSLLTPALALETGTRIAVAAVAIPHFAGTALRFWILRRHVDRGVLLGFGFASVVGGLAGALLHSRIPNAGLAVVFGLLLLLAGISELTGWMARVQWGRTSAWIAGALSGMFGGLVGNQGSIRSAALLGFRVPRDAFVATATAIALLVDLARLPVYLAYQWRDILALWPAVLAMSLAVVGGTIAGARLLQNIPQRAFRRIVAVLLIALGVYMLTLGAGR